MTQTLSVTSAYVLIFPDEAPCLGDSLSSLETKIWRSYLYVDDDDDDNDSL